MQIPQEPLDVLVIAAHPDDAEIGAGGTIISCLQQGLRVGVLDLTNGEPTPRGTVERRAAETQAATRVLGLTWRGQLDLPNRCLQPTLEARHHVAGVIRLLRPHVVMLHYWEDAHPDHVAACELGEASCFWAKLTRSDLAGKPHRVQQVWYYFSIHLRQHVMPACVIDISAHFDLKMQAVGCYHSQFGEASRDGTSVFDDLRDRARYWGWTIGVRYGEPLASRGPVGLPGLPLMTLVR
ncbi:MAG: bacillithiol biosynthesis deacetylase BshB1 [Planctomycetaceae bacterium]|nr:MAG: bacillithiol biosynthesis deacetylase BshB1 [Planctomycetaceae bacterium]